MPSDSRVASALGVLAVPIEHYRSALATTLEEVRGYLDAHHSGATGRAAQLGAELGWFAEGRIDVGKLAGLLGEEETLTPEALGDLERAAETLTALVSRGERLFHVEVPAGGNLTAAVTARLADAGRAFAAARMAVASTRRPGSAAPSPERALDGGLEAFGFSHWNAAERRMAPPLVVTVEGEDLRPAGLADVLDGGQKIVLVVEGECPPAPLARLITPTTLVIQTDADDGLASLARWSGAAIAARVPASAARFVHDPAGGAEPWRRLTVHHMPEPPKRAVGGLSPAQQAEDLRQLAALAAHAPAAPLAAVEPGPATPPPPAGDPADRLAAWLLQQANLADLP